MKCVGAVSRHTPVLSVFRGAAVPVPPNTKPKRGAGFLMDRYRTELGFWFSLDEFDFQVGNTATGFFAGDLKVDMCFFP